MKWRVSSGGEGCSQRLEDRIATPRDDLVFLEVHDFHELLLAIMGDLSSL